MSVNMTFIDLKEKIKDINDSLFMSFKVNDYPIENLKDTYEINYQHAHLAKFYQRYRTPFPISSEYMSLPNCDILEGFEFEGECVPISLIVYVNNMIVCKIPTINKKILLNDNFYMSLNMIPYSRSCIQLKFEFIGIKDNCQSYLIGGNIPWHGVEWGNYKYDNLIPNTTVRMIITGNGFIKFENIC